jgi:uracil-DNA glycosylase
MVDYDERELLAALRGYLEELRESGVEEIPFGEITPDAEAPQLQPATDDSPVLRGVGKPQARLLFVWGGPELARPSQALLDRMIGAMKVPAEEIYLLSFESGAATPEELREALLARITTVGPEVVVALGERAAQVISRKKDALSQLRGRLIKFGKTQLMVTLHPDQLVADEGLKAPVWQDLRLVMAQLGTA